MFVCEKMKVSYLRNIYGLREDEDGLFEKYLWIECRSRWLICERWTVGGASGVWNCQDAISQEIILKYFSSEPILNATSKFYAT